MTAHLFSITCTTCRARLKVRDVAAIGQILGCPKCGSMVQVVPPPGWQPGMTSDDAWSGDSSPSLGHAETPAAAPAVPEPPPISPPPVVGAAPAGAMAGRMWALWAGVSVAAVGIVVAAWWWADSSNAESSPTASSTPPPVAAAAEAPSPAVAREDKPSLLTQAAPLWDEALARMLEALEAFAAAQPPTIPDKVAVNDPFAAPPQEPPAEAPPAVAVAEPPPSPAKDEPAAEPVAVAPVEPAAPLLPADSLPSVDVETRLADVVPALKFADVTLRDFAAFVAQASTLPISFDLDAMQSAGVMPSRRIGVDAQDVAWGDILTAALDQVGLTYIVQRGQVIVTTFPPSEAAEPVERVYAVADLAGGDAAALATLVRTFVEPGSWTERGGAGNIAIEGDRWKVRQVPVVQDTVQRFLDELRSARGLPSASDDRPATNQTPRGELTAKLAKPVTVNFHRNSTLRQIADYLSQQADVDIYLNLATLADAGRSAESQRALASNGQPLGDVLDALLAPLGLTYRAIDGRSLEITSLQAARGLPEIACYDVKAIVSAGQSPTALIERIRSEVARGTWTSPGGGTAIEVDPAGGTLIVRQSQPAQRAIRALLDLAARPAN